MKSIENRLNKERENISFILLLRIMCVLYVCVLMCLFGTGDAFPVRGILSPEQSRDEAVIDSRAGEEIFVRAKIRRKFNLHISGSLLSDSACSYNERCRIYFRINEMDVYQIWYLPRL